MTNVVRVLDELHWLIARVVLAICKFVFHRSRREAPEAIVVLRNCFFGDFVVAIPALRELRSAFPFAHIVFLTATSFAPGWRDRPQDTAVFDIEPGLIDEVVRYTSEDLRSPAARAALKARIGIRTGTVSLALCYSADGLRSRLKRVLLCLLLGLPLPLGLTVARTLPAQHLFNRWRVGRSDVVHQYQAALGSVGELLLRSGHKALPWGLLERSATSGQRSAPLLIGVAPFTKQSVKQWPLERFAELMLKISLETGASFEIYGSPDERPLSLELDAQIQGGVTVNSLCGELSPAQLRMRVEAVDLLIGLDSGPMHIASLVGTPVIAIFSQITLPQFWRPWGPNGSLVSIDVSCAQCDTRSGFCPNQTRACIDGITVEAVLQRVRLLLPAQKVPL